jgi:hypothetical protein
MKTKVSIRFLAIMALLGSCSSDDASVAPSGLGVRVKAVAMLATQFPASEGEELEIYGTISTKLVVPGGKEEERMLWARDRNRWIPVASSETVINEEGSAHTFIFSEADINNEASLEFYARMWDRDPDGNPDDFLGEALQSFQVVMPEDPDDYNTLFPVQLSLRDSEGITLLVRFTVEFNKN